jgi:hypothetical protein
LKVQEGFYTVLFFSMKRIVLAALLLSAAGASAQESATLPDAPQADLQQGAQQQSAPTQSPGGAAPQQTKRILGIIPNFRAVTADEKLPPLTVKEKFMDTTHDSFDYSSILLPVLIAGYSQADNATPEFGHGAPAFGRYLWHAGVDQTVENYMVGFVVPVMTHEDIRYYTLGRGGFWKRTGYALSRAAITRNDAAKEEFNVSEIVGAGAAAGLSNLYYPEQKRGLSNTMQQWGTDVGFDAMTFVLQEFWPDINQKFFHGKQ